MLHVSETNSFPAAEQCFLSWMLISGLVLQPSGAENASLSSVGHFSLRYLMCLKVANLNELTLTVHV